MNSCSSPDNRRLEGKMDIELRPAQIRMMNTDWLREGRGRTPKLFVLLLASASHKNGRFWWCSLPFDLTYSIVIAEIFRGVWGVAGYIDGVTRQQRASLGLVIGCDIVGLR